MSGFFLKKSEQQSKFEMIPVKISSLNAYFDPITGKWIDLADEESAKVLQSLEQKKLSIQEDSEKLKSSLVDTLCWIDSTKKEISMILKDQKEILESRGFEASVLAEKLDKSLEC
jgi:hypothetical protein